MKTIALEQKDLTIQELIRLAESETVILSQKGSPAYAILPIDESDVEAWQLGDNPDFLALIERSRARHNQEGGIPLQEVRRRLGLTASG
ncbi:MAG: hypothetical protein A2Z04_01040 [Chloroflexi bacterium RBG_16_57_9]|nr:MAG: hypothetical protein A2Z04_01040 [Chloroflexi bacterium RBG_16_57_9]